MADTPRVTVPVRGHGHCDDDAAWAEFVRQYDGQPRSRPDMTDFALANRVFMADRNDLDLIVWQTAAKERIRWLSIELAKAQSAMLSAAPAPEGGAVDVIVQNAVARSMAEDPQWSEMSAPARAVLMLQICRRVSAALATRSDDKPGGAWSLDDMRELVSDEQVRHLVSATDVAQGRARLRDILNALATREEAPADHHERNLSMTNNELIEQALSHSPLEAPAEAGERDRIIAFLKDRDEACGTAEADDTERAESADAILALRAQPQARKDAQPIPVTIFCPQCALPHVDEGEWATTRHHKTHQCQGCGHEWRPFPFATVGVTHPAPDALRVREALSALVIADDHRPRGLGTPSDWIRNSYAPAIAMARQALAALQAEQKGGAA